MVLCYTRLFVKPEYHHVIYQQLGALQLWTPPEEKVSGGESPCSQAVEQCRVNRLHHVMHVARLRRSDSRAHVGERVGHAPDRREHVRLATVHLCDTARSEQELCGRTHVVRYRCRLRGGRVIRRHSRLDVRVHIVDRVGHRLRRRVH